MISKVPFRFLKITGVFRFCRLWLATIVILFISINAHAVFTVSSIPQTAFDPTTTAVVWENTNTSYPDDDDQQVVNIGFSFVFSGVSYTDVRIISNGFLHFGADQAVHRIFNNVALPVASADRLVIPYWDDMDPSQGGSVTYDTIGSAPDRRFVTTWSSVPRYGDNSTQYSFQVVLYENGDILFRYGNDDANGSSATVGIEESDSDFTQFSLNTIAVSDTLDLFWQPPAPPLSISPVDDWHFDEDAWNGTASEVVDSAGALNGTANGGVSTIELGRVCRAGQFDGIDDFILVNGIDSNLQGTASLSFWIKTIQSGNNTNWLAPGVAGIEVSGGLDDIFWGWIDASGRIGVGAGDSGHSKSTTAINDNNWHHIVHTRDATSGEVQTYVDGVLESTTNSGVGVISGSFSSLGRIEDTGGSPEYLQGDIDEIIIFDEVISGTDVQTIFNNQSANTNWDGTTRVCPGSEADPLILATDSNAVLGELSFADEDIIQYDANNDIATQLFDGSVILNNVFDIDAVHILANGNILFSTTSSSSIGGLSFEDEDVVEYNTSTGAASIFLEGDSIFSSDEDIDAFSIMPSGNYLISTTGGATLGGISINDEDVAEYNPSTDSASLYFDGSAFGITDTKAVHALASGNVLLSFQDNNNSFGGLSDIDDGDVIEYNIGTNVATIYFDEGTFSGGDEDVRAVSLVETTTAILDHLEIAVNASASTCVPSSVTIRACADSSSPCTLFTDYAETVLLSTSTTHGDWSTVTAGGTLLPGANGSAAYTFDTADNGEVVLGLSNQFAENLTITATDANTGIDTTSISVQFRDNAFVITDTDSLVGDYEVVAGRNHLFEVEAWRRDTTQTPANCAVFTEYSGNKNLKLWRTLATADPGGISPNIGGVVLPASLPTSNNVILNFVAGVASFNLSTSDVGKYDLNVQDDLAPIPFAGSTESVITVRPFGLGFTAIQSVAGAIPNSGGTATAGSGFISAGSDFTVTVGGYLHSVADDVNDDGLPDVSRDITDNGLTPSFANNIDLVISSITPTVASGGTSGVLTNATSAISDTDFSGGLGQSTDLRYSEVGSIVLSALANNYLTAGVNVSGESGDIGRFYPHALVLTSSTLEEDLSGGCSDGFIYMGESDLTVALILEAQNAQAARTSNYQSSIYNYVATIGLAVEGDDTGVNQMSRLDPNATFNSWSSGELNYSMTSTFNKGTSYDYFSSLIVGAYVSAATDGEDINSLDMNASNMGACTPSSCTEIALGAGIDMRYGRAVVENAFGPETRDLPVPVRMEYFNGSQFVLNTLDTCTLFNTGDAAFSNYVAPLSVVTPSAVSSPPITTGIGFIELMMPNVTGSVDVELAVPGYLQFDWDGAPLTLENPEATATFGTYRGNDRIIYRREVLQ